MTLGQGCAISKCQVQPMAPRGRVGGGTHHWPLSSAGLHSLSNPNDSAPDPSSQGSLSLVPLVLLLCISSRALESQAALSGSIGPNGY